MKSDAELDRGLIAILSASNFVIGMGAFLVIGLLSPLATSLDLSPAQAGQIMTVYAISYAVLSPLLVSLTGQIGRRRVMAIALAIFAAAALLAALAPGLWAVNLSRVLAAGGAGIFTPVAAATAAGLAPPEARGRVLASVFFGLTLAQVLGVPTGSFVAYTFGWRAAFLIVVALALPCLYLIWTRVPAGLSFQPVRLADLSQVLRDAPMMLAVMFTGSFLGAIYVLFTYVAPLLEETMGFGRNGITLALLVAGIGAVLGNILGGLMADRLGPRRWLLLVALAQVAIMPMFSTLPVAGWMVFALIFAWNTVGWSFMASQQTRLVSLAGERAPVVLALNAAAIYVGAAVGSAIGGAVITSFGLQALGAAAGLCALLAVAHTIASHRLSGDGR